MKCPHCLAAYHSQPTLTDLRQDKNGSWSILHEICPACGGAIFLLKRKGHRAIPGGGFNADRSRDLGVQAYPSGTGRPPVAPQVPDDLSGDYREACSVLGDSPKASAALARRALQHLLREHAHVKHSDLVNEIQEVLDSGKLPTQIAEGLDAVRQIGNFAAHPIKSRSTGEIVPVEPGEAEWTLDVLESLFDFYFVQPSVLKAKREALNKKLQDAGKRPLK